MEIAMAVLFCLFTCLFLFSRAGHACTTLMIRDAKGRIYHGRTMEFALDPAMHVVYYPHKTAFTTKAPDGTPSKSFTAKYALIGIGGVFGNKVTNVDLVEGVNSEGLSFSENMFTPASTSTLKKKDYGCSLPLAYLGTWALATCKNIDELKLLVPDLPVWLPKLPAEFGESASPFHFAFYDKNGKSMVVEYIHGQLNMHDNPLGVMTNAPELPWHLINLQNYSMLRNIDVPKGQLMDLVLTQPDTGISTFALPSSDTSVGRFVRAAFYANYAHKASTPDGAMLELSHLMNKFDRPKNMTCDPVPASPDTAALASEYTVWTALTDLDRGIFMVRHYNQFNYNTYSFEAWKNETKAVYNKVG